MACNPASLNTKTMRWGFNIIPDFPGAGAHITYIADDWRKERFKVPLKLAC